MCTEKEFDCLLSAVYCVVGKDKATEICELADDLIRQQYAARIARTKPAGDDAVSFLNRCLEAGA